MCHPLPTLRDRTNYSDWSRTHLHLLTTHDCLSLVLGHSPRPQDPSTTNESPESQIYKDLQAACELWDQKNAVARRIILSRLDTKIWEGMPSDVVFERAEILWNWLEGQYGGLMRGYKGKKKLEEGVWEEEEGLREEEEEGLREEEEGLRVEG